jgi:hypothetical protein
VKDPNSELHVYTSPWEPDGAFILAPGTWEVQSYGILWWEEEGVGSILPWHQISKANVVNKDKK